MWQQYWRRAIYSDDANGTERDRNETEMKIRANRVAQMTDDVEWTVFF